jgi:hypothetical protein
MTTMTHAAHSMRAMEPRMGRSKARTVTDTSFRRHFSAVATADVSSAFPMNTAALAMNSLSILRMRRGHARAVCVAHELAKIQTVIVCNLAPAIACSELRNDTVEALASGVSQ